MRTVTKHASGYTLESGVIKKWLAAFLVLGKDVEPLYLSNKVKVIAVACANDGTALKPSIQ